MEMNNFDQQASNQSGELSNEQAIPGVTDSDQNDAGNQEYFPENGNQSQTVAATDNGILANDIDEEDLTANVEQEDADDGNGNDLEEDQGDLGNDTENEDFTSEDEDQSANDADGNGGYPDAVNPA
jgi:hypothetical protein